MTTDTVLTIDFIADAMQARDDLLAFARAALAMVEGKQ